MRKSNQILRNGLLCVYSLLFIMACADSGGEDRPAEDKPENEFNYTISIITGTGGTLTPAAQITGPDPRPGTVFIDSEGKARFDVRSKRGFTIKDVIGCNGTLSGSTNLFGAKTYTTGVLMEDCTITATFKRIIVNTIAGEGGTISLPNPLSFESDGTIIFSVNTESGYILNTVSGCGVRKLVSNLYVTEVIVRDCTINANFTRVNFPPVDTSSPPVDNGTPPTQGSRQNLDSKISMDDKGNVIALWLHNDGTRYVIQTKRYIEGAGWGEIEAISSYADRISSPQIAMNDSGNAIAVWSQSDGTRYNIWMSHYVADTGWSAAGVIESNSYENEFEGIFGGSVGAFLPKVAMDNKGNAVVVWHQRGSNTENDIWSNRYDIVKGWSGAEIIGTETNGRIQEAQIVMNNDGSALAVWKNFANNKHKIQANRYIDNTGWGQPEFIDTNIFIGTPGEIARLWAETAAPPQMATDGNGNAIAIWDQYNGEVSSIWVNQYNSGSGWGGAKPFVNETTAIIPQLSMNTDGNGIVVFQQHDGNQFNIWARQYLRDSGWSDPRLIEPPESSGSATSQKAAIDLNGNAIAVWRKNDGNVNNVFANIYSVENDWGIAKLIETKNAETYSPQVVTGMNGNTMIVWTSRIGIYYQLWAIRYSENADWGETTQININ